MKIDEAPGVALATPIAENLKEPGGVVMCAICIHFQAMQTMASLPSLQRQGMQLLLLTLLLLLFNAPQEQLQALVSKPKPLV